MVIGIICSTTAYPIIPSIAKKLVDLGHVPVMPNCFDDPVYNEDTDSMSEEDMEREITRSKAVTAVAGTIIKNGELALKAVKHVEEYGEGRNGRPLPPMLEA